jgi:hypothetical protein
MEPLDTVLMESKIDKKNDSFPSLLALPLSRAPSHTFGSVKVTLFMRMNRTNIVSRFFV